MDAESLLVDAAAVASIIQCLGRDAFMDALVSRLSQTIRAMDPGVVQIPPRAGVAHGEADWGLIEWMPAHFGAEGTTVKVVAYHPSNPGRRGIPTVISTIYRFDASSGHLVGIVDGTFLTALRTGAASAVASRILARPDSRVLGLVGCGAQAVTQAHALSRAFPLERIMGYDILDETASSLPDRLRFLGVPSETVPRADVPALLEECDILCTCTSAAPGEGPLFPDFHNRTHLHINAVGSDFHGKFELPVALLHRALVCPDFLEQAAQEGECQQLDAGSVGPDLRTLVQNAEQYMAARDSLTVFDSTGWALEDHVAASMMFDCARQIGVGRPVAVECLPPDPKDPYSLLDSAASIGAAAVRGGRAVV